MSRYARIEGSAVVEIIEVPKKSKVTDLYHPDFVRTLVDISSVTPAPAEMWTLGEDGNFNPPIVPTESPAEVSARNAALKDELLSQAAVKIAPLQDAVDLGIETDEEVRLLKAWKVYRVDVNRVDTQAPNVDWPLLPE
ncbi:tail fiber assembly protein [Achromobacter aegrifaciens]